MDSAPVKKKSTHGEVKRLIGWLIISELFLVLIYLCSAYAGNPSWHIQVLFDLDREANIPAWFSSMQLFAIGLVFLFVSCLRNFKIFTDKIFFKISGLVFIYFSMDEVAVIHEKITSFLRKFDFIPRFKGGRGIWIMVYFFIGVIIAFIFHRNFIRLYQRYRREITIIFIGCCVLVLGAVGVEILGYIFLTNSHMGLWDYIETATEEFLEMLGASIILYGAILSLPIYDKNRTV